MKEATFGRHGGILALRTLSSPIFSDHNNLWLLILLVKLLSIARNKEACHLSLVADIFGCVFIVGFRNQCPVKIDQFNFINPELEPLSTHWSLKIGPPAQQRQDGDAPTKCRAVQEAAYPSK